MSINEVIMEPERKKVNSAYKNGTKYKNRGSMQLSTQKGRSAKYQRSTKTYTVSFCKELEMVNERFHRALHFCSIRRTNFGIINFNFTRRHLIEALKNDAAGLAHLFDT